MAGSITISRGRIVEGPDDDNDIYLIIEESHDLGHDEVGVFLTKADLEAMLKLFDEPEKESKK